VSFKKAVKILVIVIAGLLGLGVLALIGLIIIPPEEYVPAERNLIDESQFELNEKVGWYLLGDGSYRMITWGAENGLTINRFDTLAQSKLTPVTADQFIWKRASREIEVIFERDANDSVIAMTWTDDSVTHRAEKLTNHLYDQLEVSYKNGDVALVGLLLKPVSTGPHPAVVFIHGSGVSHRQIFWYLYQADYLARHGVTVLLPDKRGCGKSESEWHTVSILDFAEDALAGVRFLMDNGYADSSHVGLMGLSQGGMIAPLAASRSSVVDFVINVSGSATTFNEQVSHEIANDLNDGGCPGFLLPIVEPVFTKRAKARRPMWWEKNGAYDPEDYWRVLTIPALVVYGSEDEYQNVPVARSVARLDSAVALSGNSHFLIEVHEGSGHAIGDRKTGWIRQEYLENLVSWIKKITHPGKLDL
jgi:pimeloyl-ACP methyl ester carboxylesterase